MSKKVILIILFTLVLKCLSAQRWDIDSLKKQLETELADTSRIKTYTRLVNTLTHSTHISGESLDEALIYAQKALELSKEIGFRRGEAEATWEKGYVLEQLGDYEGATENYLRANELYVTVGDLFNAGNINNQLGIMQAIKGNYDSSLVFFDRSRELREKAGDSAGVAGSINNLGIVHYRKGELLKAIDHYLESLEIMEKLNNGHGMVEVMTNIGLIHVDRKDFDKAKKYYRRCLRVCMQIDSQQDLAILTNNIGDMFARLDQTDSALYYQRWSYRLYRYLKDECGVAYPAVALGELYRDVGMEDSVRYYINIGKERAYTCENAALIVGANIVLGELALDKQDFDASEKAFFEAYETAKKTGFKDQQKESSQLLYQFYKRVNNIPKSFKYLEIYQNLSDSLYAEEINQQFVRQEAEYEFQKEKQQLKFESREKELKLEDQIKRQQIISR
jgi:tetratricopeptide (TPR) repeat protein